MNLDPQPLPTRVNFVDLSGTGFGKLTVLHYVGEKHGRSMWAVRCECGRISAIPTRSITNRKQPGCGGIGCCINTKEHAIGEIIGPWKILSRAGRDKGNCATWNVACTRCGTQKVVAGADMRRPQGTRCRSEACRGDSWRHLNTDGTMRCTTCKRSFSFDLSHFAKNPAAIGGIGRRCLDCARKYARESDRKRKQKALMHYSNGTMTCACCCESHVEFLTFDHVNGDGAAHRKQIKINTIHAWLIKNNFPLGFRVLCYNCNSALGMFGYCPHDPERMKQDRSGRFAKPLQSSLGDKPIEIDRT